MTFRKLSVLLLVFATLAGTGLIVIGQTSPIIHQDSRMLAARAKNAKKLFKQNCVKCHGTDGAGETSFGQIAGAADFTDSEWQKRVDDQRLVNSITYGRGQMPSFDKKFSKEQIKSLVSYIRAFKN